jgi:hypothetical protein
MEFTFNKQSTSAFDRVLELQNDLIKEALELSEKKLSITETYDLVKPIMMSFGKGVFGVSLEIDEEDDGRICIYIICKELDSDGIFLNEVMGRYLGELDVYELCKLIDALKNNNFYIQK